MKYELSLCPEDREKHGGPEWVAFEYDQLADMTSDVIDEWEQQIIEGCGKSIATLVFAHPLSSGLVRRVMVWLGRRMADVETPPFKDFKIKALKTGIRPAKGGDVDPPDRTSSAQPTEVKRSGRRGKS